jgi:transcriptional regulator with XRE-family HTH domain
MDWVLVLLLILYIVMSNISDILSRLLTKHHLSQRKLANKANVNYVTINRIINDYKFRPTNETIEKIARGLGCTQEELDEMLQAVGRVPTELETKVSENSNATKLYRRISQMNADEIEKLLDFLESKEE